MFEGYLLFCIYDMIIADEKGAQIIEWTTAHISPRIRQLKYHWQTRLYLYILVETSDYTPSEVNITYYFVNSSGLTQSFTFNYSEEQHQKTLADLKLLIEQLNGLLKVQKSYALPSINQQEVNLSQKEKAVNLISSLEGFTEIPI